MGSLLVQDRFMHQRQLAVEQSWFTGECGLVFEAYAKASPETKNTLITGSWKDCNASCPTPMEAQGLWEIVLAAESSDRTQVLVDWCDTKHPEPVFSGDNEMSRPQMPWIDFMVLRHAFEVIDTRVVGRPSLIEKTKAAKQHILLSATRASSSR